MKYRIVQRAFHCFDIQRKTCIFFWRFVESYSFLTDAKSRIEGLHKLNEEKERYKQKLKNEALPKVVYDESIDDRCVQDFPGS